MSLKNLSVRKKIPKFYKSKILNQKVNKIFKKFEKSFKIDTNFIVAVSGGADSLALAFLTKVYALKKNINPRYFIVDHKLRKGSTYEAHKVRKILKHGEKIIITAGVPFGKVGNTNILRIAKIISESKLT